MANNNDVQKLKDRKKAGRPVLSNKRNNLIRVYLNDDELLLFEKNLMKTNLKKGDYMRKLAVGNYVKERISDDMKEQIQQLIGIANNINQLSKYVNFQKIDTSATEVLHKFFKIVREIRS